MFDQKEYIQKKISNLQDYEYLLKFKGPALYYQGLYEYFLRDIEQKNNLSILFKMYENEKKEIEEYVYSKNVSVTVLNSFKPNSSVFLNTFLSFKKCVAEVGHFPVIKYKKNHPYLHSKIDKKIFEILSFLYDLETFIYNTGWIVIVSREDLKIKYKLNEFGYATCEIISIKFDDFIKTSTYIITDYWSDEAFESGIPLSDYWKTQLSEGLFISESNINNFLDTTYINSTKITYEVNYNKYPVLTPDSMIDYSIDYRLLQNGDLLREKGFFVKDHLSSPVEIETLNKLLNTIKDNKKLIQYLYIYDSSVLYQSVIKQEIEKNLENDTNINKASTSFLWLAISLVIKENYKKIESRTVQNYHAFISNIIKKSLYSNI